MSAIGIDLGTTYSCAAVWRDDHVEIITNDQGNRITPSYVAFTPTEHLIGDAARNQVAGNPLNTVFDSKRLIGRRFADSSVQSDKALWPFQVENHGGKPEIKVQFMGETKRYKPEEISSMVLKKMKDNAEAFLGHEVKKAVVTVPAYFNDSQRKATREAGAIAGLEVIRIINEPTAAAYAYGLGKRIKESGEHNVLIFDLGGGTLDVSLVRIGGGKMEVKATAGDTHLGGEDFDNRLVKYIVEEIKSKQNKDVSTDPRMLRVIKSACEKAKRMISFTGSSRVEIDSFDQNINYIIRRAKFEELCMDLFKKCMESVEKCLSDAKMGKKEVEEVILVGGSTRIPKLQQLLEEFFGKKLNKTINADEAVANGAAVQAAILTGEGNQRLQNLIMVDVTPLSLGSETVGGVMNVVIPRNSTIPTKNSALLGSFLLEGIPPAPRGVPDVDICFELDENGILTVTAESRASGARNTLKISKDEGEGSSNAAVERMVKEARECQVEDELMTEKITKLYNYALNLKKRIKDLGRKLDEEEEKKIDEAVDKTMSWLSDDKYGSVSELDQTYDMLEKLCIKSSTK